MTSAKCSAITAIATTAIILAAVSQQFAQLRERAIEAEGQVVAYEKANVLSSAAVIKVRIDRGKHGMIESWSLGAETLLGYSAHEVIGQEIDILIPSRMLDKHHAAFEKYLTAKAVRDDWSVQIVECSAITKSGREIPIVMTTRPIYRNGQLMLLATMDKAEYVKQAKIKG